MRRRWIVEARKIGLGQLVDQLIARCGGDTGKAEWFLREGVQTWLEYGEFLPDSEPNGRTRSAIKAALASLLEIP